MSIVMFMIIRNCSNYYEYTTCIYFVHCITSQC